MEKSKKRMEKYFPLYWKEKLNKIQDNFKSAIEKRDEVQKYSFALLQLVDYILLVIKIRFCNIEQRYNTIKQLKQERDYNYLKPNNENYQKTSFKNQDMDYE